MSLQLELQKIAEYLGGARDELVAVDYGTHGGSVWVSKAIIEALATINKLENEVKDLKKLDELNSLRNSGTTAR